MKTMTDPRAFAEIHRREKGFVAASTNMEMRFYISSFGFKATRELADQMFKIIDEKVKQYSRTRYGSEACATANEWAGLGA